MSVRTTVPHKASMAQFEKVPSAFREVFIQQCPSSSPFHSTFDLKYVQGNRKSQPIGYNLNCASEGQ